MTGTVCPFRFHFGGGFYFVLCAGCLLSVDLGQGYQIYIIWLSQTAKPIIIAQLHTGRQKCSMGRKKLQTSTSNSVQTHIM